MPQYILSHDEYTNLIPRNRLAKPVSDLVKDLRKPFEDLLLMDPALGKSIIDQCNSALAEFNRKIRLLTLSDVSVSEEKTNKQT